VDIDTGVDVVEHVPAGVVGIFIDDKIVAAIPAPVRADGPVPSSDFKGETTGQPETVMVAIEAFDAVAKRGTKMFEAAVLERMIEVETLVVGTVMAVPMVIVDVRSGIDVAGRMVFGFRLGAWLWTGKRRSRDASLVCSGGGSARAHRGVATMPAELDREPEPGEKWCVISFLLLELHMAW